MVVLVGAETLLLVLLIALVLGLLRSNAEILRRLGTEDEPAAPELLDAARAPERDAQPAASIAGSSPTGDALKVLVAPGGPTTLVAFLSSGCSTCAGFWDGFSTDRGDDLPASVRRVIVCKGVEVERPALLAELAPPEVPVVLSSQAWADYQVPGTPYFVLVDGPSGRVAGEGTAAGWTHLTSLLRDAAREHGHFDDAAMRPEERVRAADRSVVVDGVLERAGIGPDHPSLHPTSSTPRRTDDR